MPFNLRKYQHDAIASVKSKISQGSNSMMLHLPTGAGKTILATFIIEHLLHKPNSRVLFLAHRKEILDQTKEKIKNIFPNFSVGIEQGDRSADLNSQIIIASIQSLSNRKNLFPQKHFTAIICDECHHSLAESWLETINYFKNPDTILIGLTATARRTDGRSALNLFNEIAFEIEQAELQDLGYLAPIEYHTTKTELFLDKIKMTKGDFQAKALSSVMNSPEVRSITIGAWVLKARNKKTIAFCASVDHAIQLAENFKSLGYPALSVDGRTKDRDGILRKFHTGEIQILTNFGIFVEGFDEPSIECVLLARPTTSPLIYNQCLGRGLRTFPGKDKCIVLDIVDRSTHQLQYSASDLSGLPKGWKSGGDVFREKKSLSKVKVTDPQAFLKIQQSTSMREIQNILMSLPPECVLAGVDGKSVPTYNWVDTISDAETAEKAARNILRQGKIPFLSMKISEDKIELFFPDSSLANKEFSIFKWHIQEATGRKVIFSSEKKDLGPQIIYSNKERNPYDLLKKHVSRQISEIENLNGKELRKIISIAFESRDFNSQIIDEIHRRLKNKTIGFDVLYDLIFQTHKINEISQYLNDIALDYAQNTPGCPKSLLNIHIQKVGLQIFYDFKNINQKFACRVVLSIGKEEMSVASFKYASTKKESEHLACADFLKVFLKGELMPATRTILPKEVLSIPQIKKVDKSVVSKISEIAQKSGIKLEYLFTKTGPDNNPTFTCHAKSHGNFKAETLGKGPSKQAAKIDASQHLLDLFEDHLNPQAESAQEFSQNKLENYVGKLSIFCRKSNIKQPTFDFQVQQNSDGIIHICKSRTKFDGKKIEFQESGSSKKMVKQLASKGLLEKVKALKQNINIET